LNINGIELDPGRNPGVLDTITWDVPSALGHCDAMSRFLEECALAVGTAHCANCLKAALVNTPGVPASAAVKNGTGYFLLNLSDEQKLFVAASPQPTEIPVETIGCLAGGRVALIPVNTATTRWFVTDIAPHLSPRAHGSVPRLGVGNRMTTLVWPGVIEALREIGGPGETIQNSAYRELAPKSVILSRPGAEVTYLPGHGSLSIGHTGSSIEGFWLAGVIAHIENRASHPYGADLDHIPVKSADEAGIVKAKSLIQAGRHFTFFTLDTSFLFDFSKADPGGRYDLAIDIGTELYRYIKSLKDGEKFDYEFSLDEGPAITEPSELRYVLQRLTANGVELSFIAPNVGFWKRKDYDRPDGMPGLEARVRELSAIAGEYGVMLDFHSGSDKSSLTYQTISRATDGRLKIKVSGKLQLILSEVLADMEPDFFNEWWDYTLVSARSDADSGSEAIASYVKAIDDRRSREGASFKRSPKDLFFTDCSFGMIGAKDETGNFLFRHRFYDLSSEVRNEYTRRVVAYVTRLADDLGLRRK